MSTNTSSSTNEFATFVTSLVVKEFSKCNVSDIKDMNLTCSWPTTSTKVPSQYGMTSECIENTESDDALVKTIASGTATEAASRAKSWWVSGYSDDAGQAAIQQEVTDKLDLQAIRDAISSAIKLTDISIENKSCDAMSAGSTIQEKARAAVHSSINGQLNQCTKLTSLSDALVARFYGSIGSGGLCCSLSSFCSCCCCFMMIMMVMVM